MPGPTIPICDAIHAEKYRADNESFREAMGRVANALQDDQVHYHEFRDILLDMKFLPAGRVQAAMGSSKNVTPYNCFVSGTIEDSFCDGPGSIMGRAHQSASTMRQGGGIGYDFSTLRPKGDIIRGVQSVTDGPMAFMPIYDSVCRATASAGNRRGAQMGVLRVDHPDIEAFIHAKQNVDKLTGFNLSIAITDEFMNAVAAGQNFPLRFNGQVYRTIDARALWETIMRSTYDWAEPGVLFIDAINRMNNLYYCETIAATNPCGEQPLPPFGACLLGSLNLVKFVTKDAEGVHSIDFDEMSRVIPHIIRAMDNVVDRARYPLPEQEQEAKSKRRMGIGVTGLANAIEACGALYGSPEFLEIQEQIERLLTNECYRASAMLAKEKGAFPLYDQELYCAGNFIRTLDDDVQALIKANGIRNSHLTSKAPTGTISFCADNPSSGIEPVFSYSQRRSVITGQGKIEAVVQDYGQRVFGVNGRVCADVTVDQHVKVLALSSRYTDSAVSKTCNVPHDIDWNDFKNTYTTAWELGAKGCTTYRVGGKREAILMDAASNSSPVVETEEGGACYYDPDTGTRSCE